MRRRQKNTEVASNDEDCDSGSETPDSDAVSAIVHSVKNRNVVPRARRGRSRLSTSNKRQKIEDDSDDSVATQPSTYRRKTPSRSLNNPEGSDGGSDNSSPQPCASQGKTPSGSGNDSDTGSDSTSDTIKMNKMTTPSRVRQGRRINRQPVNNKRRRIQDSSDDNWSPQPSTSGMASGRRSTQNVNQSDFSGSESGSETPDSDFVPIDDSRNVRKKKVSTQSKRGKPKLSNVDSKRHRQSANSKKSSQSTHVDQSLDPALIESLAQKLVYFLLIRDQRKYVVRKKAIITHVFMDEVHTPKVYGAVIKKANQILQEVYGMEILFLGDHKDQYLIVNILHRDLGVNDYIEIPKLRYQQHGLIMYLLAVIFMNENSITEDELTKALKQLDIDLTSRKLHPIFGDVKKYITSELVKQMYLTYKCVSKEPPKYEFEWGARAEQEFDRKDLLQFVCEVMGDTNPRAWILQYKDAESRSQQNKDGESRNENK